jgi:hypothetical protein
MFGSQAIRLHSKFWYRNHFYKYYKKTCFKCWNYFLFWSINYQQLILKLKLKRCNNFRTEYVFWPWCF